MSKSVGKSAVTSIATEPRPSARTPLIALLYAARGYDAVAVGLVATASLLGTALLTLVVGWIAPRHDLRALLIFGAGLMAATGLAFPAVEQFALIALVAFIGTVNP